MKPRHVISLLACLLIITACQNKKKEEAVNAIKQWMGKEILFLKNSIFTIRGTDTIDFVLNASDYKIVSFIDTAGCVSCQLKLAEWQRFTNISSRQGKQNRSHRQSHRKSERQEVLSEITNWQGTGNICRHDQSGAFHPRTGLRHFP